MRWLIVSEKKGLSLVNTPNNIARGRIEIDAQINRLYYNILKNIQRDNRDLIIKVKKGDELSEEQKNILKKIDTINTLSCRLSRAEMEEIFKNNNSKTEKKIKEHFNTLQTATFEFCTGEKSSSMVQLIGRVDIDDEGYTVQLDAQLYKYLFYNLEVGYTPVNLATLFNLQSQYSQTLYVLLRGWTGVKQNIEFTVKELREHFKTGDKYKNYRDFKRRCIMQAVEEINKTGSLTIEKVSETKNGRNTHSVIFTVIDHEPRLIIPEKKEKKVDEQIFWIDGIRVASYGIIAAIEVEFGSFKPYSYPVEEMLRKSYKKMLSRDVNGEKMITYKNLDFFLTIARSAFETNELALEQSISEDITFEYDE